MKSLILSMVIWAALKPCLAQLQTVMVETEGVAEAGAVRQKAVQQAVRDAQLRAIEQVCGVRLVGVDVGRDWRLKRSGRLAYTQGIVVRWELIGQPRFENELVHVSIRAWVVPLSTLRSESDWREIWQMIGHPPLTLNLQYEGEADYKKIAILETRDRLKAGLQEMGVAIGTASHGWTLIARIRVLPVSKMGNAAAPYEIDCVASWKAEVTLSLKEPSQRRGDKTAAVEMHPLGSMVQTAASFSGDEEAIRTAIRLALEPMQGSGWRTILSEVWIYKLLAE